MKNTITTKTTASKIEEMTVAFCGWTPKELKQQGFSLCRTTGVWHKSETPDCLPIGFIHYVPARTTEVKSTLGMPHNAVSVSYFCRNVNDIVAKYTIVR